MSYPCMVIFASCRKVFEKSYAVSDLIINFAVSVASQLDRTAQTFQLLSRSFAVHWILNASHIKAVISGMLRKLLFSAQATPGEQKASFFLFCINVPCIQNHQNKTAVCMTKRMQSRLRAAQCQIREEGCFHLQLEKNNSRNNLSVLKWDICNFCVWKKTEVAWEPPGILSYQSKLHMRKVHWIQFCYNQVKPLWFYWLQGAYW